MPKKEGKKGDKQSQIDMSTRIGEANARIIGKKGKKQQCETLTTARKRIKHEYLTCTGRKKNNCTLKEGKNKKDGEKELEDLKDPHNEHCNLHNKIDETKSLIHNATVKKLKF